MAALRVPSDPGGANVPVRRVLVHWTGQSPRRAKPDYSAKRRDPIVSSCCSGSCSGIARQFDAKAAAGNLRRYQQKGPDQTTRLLREFVVQAGVGDTVLDIGAGIGALSFELLARGVRSATAVDAAPAYLAAARSEAERRGTSDVFTTLKATSSLSIGQCRLRTLWSWIVWCAAIAPPNRS